MINVPMFYAMYFPLYEKGKVAAEEHFGWGHNTFAVNAFASAFSAMCCNVVMNPMWVS